MPAYYNEIDPYAAQWLRNLIAAGHIAPGDVDERSIEDIRPSDLAGYTQCHFFAGIGVWSRALRGAGWSDDRLVWTGSCPCQPFSAAGKGAGFDDERHLWPAFYWLIEQCRPPVVFGEQVASPDGLKWLNLVQADLEGAGYRTGAADLCAAGVGAPHIRQRLYWVADTEGNRSEMRLNVHAELRGQRLTEGRDSDRMADAKCVSNRGQEQTADHGESQADRSSDWTSGRGGSPSRMADNNNKGLEGRGQPGRECGTERAAGPSGVAGGLADADGGDTCTEGLQRCGQQRQQSADGRARIGLADAGDGSGQRCQPRAIERGLPAGAGEDAAVWPRPTNGHWRAADWLLCRDGKWRPIEPGTFPLAHGVTARVGRLRAYGNAIIPQVAQAFIEAYL